MNQSRFLSKKSALQLLKTKLSLQDSNIYFNFNSNDMPELTHISIDLVDRIVSVANYNILNYNIRVVGISINTAIHATMFYSGNVGRQEVFITPAELNKFWFDAVDKYEELASYTNSSKFDVISDRDAKIKSLQGRIEDLVLEKEDLNDYASELEKSNKHLKKSLEEMRVDWETDQVELKKCLKCCIVQDEYVSKLKAKLHQKETELANSNIASNVANNCMDYSYEYETLSKKFNAIADIVNETNNWSEHRINIGEKGMSIDTNQSHCCSPTKCLTPGKEYSCHTPETAFNFARSSKKSKITDYYKPVDDTCNGWNFQSKFSPSKTQADNSCKGWNFQPIVSPSKNQNITFKITDNANNKYWNRSY